MGHLIVREPMDECRKHSRARDISWEREERWADHVPEESCISCAAISLLDTVPVYHSHRWHHKASVLLVSAHVDQLWVIGTSLWCGAMAMWTRRRGGRAWPTHCLTHLMVAEVHERHEWQSRVGGEGTWENLWGGREVVGGGERLMMRVRMEDGTPRPHTCPIAQKKSVAVSGKYCLYSSSAPSAWRSIAALFLWMPLQWRGFRFRGLFCYLEVCSDKITWSPWLWQGPATLR